ncbi:MAG: hypothetical protein ACI845_001343 [Gammaproteobacteria bacterium]|jgi:hypothetical protein
MTHSLVRLFGIVVFCLLLLNCSGQPDSQEKQIDGWLEKAVQATENRDASSLIELLAKNFRDKKGNNSKQIEKILRLYFFRHKNIFLMTRIQDLHFDSEDQAYLVVYVAMAGSIISDVNLLSSLRAKIYRFDLELIKQDEWLVQSVNWQPAAASDMHL